MNRVYRWAPRIGLAAWLGALVWYLPGAINHDTAWSLYSTGRWIDGARFYVDLVEINPPLNFYLHVPPVMFSRWTGLGLMPSFVLWTFLLVALALLLCVHITRQQRKSEPYIWTVLLAGSLVTSLVVPRASFGQREHIAVVLSLPYLFGFAVRRAGGRVETSAAMLSGFLAAVGLALKPYFLLVPLMFELAGVIRARSLKAALRPDSCVLVVSGLIYGISIPIVHPEYLGELVPLALATYSWGFGVPLGQFLVQGSTLMLLGMLATYLVVRPRMRRPELTDPFWLAAVGFFGAYLWQMKGFPYHTGPVLALTFIVLLPLALRGPLVGEHGLLEPPQRLVAFLGVLVIATLFASGGRYPSSRDTPLFQLIQREAPNGTVAALATNMSFVFPLVIEADLTWASRFPTVWPVPGVWRAFHGSGRPPTEDQRLELVEIMDWTRRAVAEDLRDFRPDLVIVDVRPRKSVFDPLEFDWLTWAAEDSLFREVWLDYRYLELIGPVAVYQLRSGRD